MDEQTLVKYMMTAAKRDVFNGKGRIVIPEFLKELPINPKPTIIEMLLSWRKHKPETPINWRMNVLIINLDYSGSDEAYDKGDKVL